MTVSIRIMVSVLLFLFVSSLSIHANAFKPEGALNLTLEERRWLQDHPEVSLAYDGYFPPYSYMSDNGEVEGFVVEIFELMEKDLGISFKVHPEHEWSELYASAQNSKVDVVATMVNRPERQEWFRFSDPYVFKSLVIIARDNNESITRRDDLAGKRVALVKNYQYVDKVLKEFPTVQPVFVADMLDAMNAVSVGDADAAITFLGAGHYYRNKYLLTNLKYAAVFDKRQSNESIAVRKDWPQLVSIFNKYLASIPGYKLQEIRARWLPVDYMENLVEIELTNEEKEWIKAHPVIRLGVDPEFAPFEYIEDQEYRGMASDYVKLLNQRLNMNMQIVDGLTWKQVIAKAKQGEIDVLPAIGETRERKGYLKYTSAYLSFHRVVITRNNLRFVADLADLDGYKVAVQANSSHHGFITENSNITPVLYKTLQESLMAVSGGEVDAFIGNVASSTYWIRKLNLTNLKIAAPVSNEVQTLHFAVRKDWPLLVSILQKGLDSITPRRKKIISEKWLSFEYDPVVDLSLIWKTVAGFSVLLFAVIFWNLMLKRLVRIRTSQLDHSANYDQLTDLPNRFLIMDRLLIAINEARRSGDKVALLSIDIDNFKKINDTFGHEKGDVLLSEVAVKLKESLREGDMPGRLGGDQFLVIFNHISDVADTAVLAERILSNFNQPFVVGKLEIMITVSIGISIFPDDAQLPETLLKNADSATHYSKEQSFGEYAFYTENLNQKVSRRLMVEQRMRGALKRDELQVFYQPKMDAKTQKIQSFEALLRWHNPELGSVSPAEFIPIAEQNGLIDEMAQYVIVEALRVLAKWQANYSESLSMAINLSPVQFRSEDFIGQIESAILNAGLESKKIEFEITEGVLLSEYEGIGDKLKKLERLGVTLTMDDFGTGYSSLSYLRKYKFDSLKIDREFIMEVATDESARKLVAATIAMAHELDMLVVAEGVETNEQCDFLVEHHCDILQGWLFSKAIPEEEMDAMLDNMFL